MSVRIEKRFVVVDWMFDRSLVTIRKSGVPDLLDRWRAPNMRGGIIGAHYTIEAYLTAELAVNWATKMRASIADVLRFFAAAPKHQLGALGLTPDLGEIIAQYEHWETNPEYNRLRDGITEATKSIDATIHIPARRMTTAEYHAIIDGYTEEQRNDMNLAISRRQIVMNRLLAASIHEDTPTGRGDVVVDETIIDLVKHSTGMGAKPHRWRAASQCGGPWARNQRGEIIDPHTKGEIGKAGFGVGVTALTRIGPPDALHSVPSLFVGIDMHRPTSGSVDALSVALEHAYQNNLLNSERGRAPWPRITVDCGYNIKHGWPDLILKHKLYPVARYPKHWNLVWDSGSNAHGVPYGPPQVAGAFFCPAVKTLLDPENHVPGVQQLWDELATKERKGRIGPGDDPIKSHNEYQRRILPFLMGTNSRPYLGRKKIGRPIMGEDPEIVTKIDLVCPAALGNVTCPLRPDAQARKPGCPEASPTWSADTYVCCSQSSVTVTLTKDQKRMAQWGTIPTTWKHGLYFEASRSFTEQRFDRVKSDDGAGIDNLWHGPRREPLIAISVALGFAAVNLDTQRRFKPRDGRAESIDIRYRKLKHHLGEEPVKQPPLT